VAICSKRDMVAVRGITVEKGGERFEPALEALTEIQPVHPNDELAPPETLLEPACRSGFHGATGHFGEVPRPSGSDGSHAPRSRPTRQSQLIERYIRRSHKSFSGTDGPVIRQSGRLRSAGRMDIERQDQGVTCKTCRSSHSKHRILCRPAGLLGSV